MSVTVTITKSNVLAEAAKTTAYEGAHAGAFDNVFIKEQDQAMLDRYWIEAATMATEVMKEFIQSLTTPTSGDASTNYVATLVLPANSDSTLNDAISNSVYQHFCNYMVGKWLEMLCIEKESKYLESSASNLAECKEKIYYRKAPTRP